MSPESKTEKFVSSFSQNALGLASRLRNPLLATLVFLGSGSAALGQPRVADFNQRVIGCDPCLGEPASPYVNAKIDLNKPLIPTETIIVIDGGIVPPPRP